MLKVIANNNLSAHREHHNEQRAATNEFLLIISDVGYEIVMFFSFRETCFKLVSNISFTIFREHHDRQHCATNNFLLTVCEIASWKACLQSASKKLPSGGLVRPRPPLGLRPAGCNGPPCFSKFLARAPSAFFCFRLLTCPADLIIKTCTFCSWKPCFKFAL